MKRILCFFLCHNWTSKVEEGIKPTQRELSSVVGFYEYVLVYCQRCGKISDIALRNLKKILEENISGISEEGEINESQGG